MSVKDVIKDPISNLMSLAKTVAPHFDSWSNIFTGQGIMGKDSRMGWNYNYNRLSESQVERLFASDDIARRVVALPTEEGTREWIETFRTNKDGDPETPQKILDRMEELDAQEVFQHAWEWARMYGGAGVFVAADDGSDDLREPLILEKIRRIRALTVLSRYELSPLFIDTDLGSKRFGKPLIYQLTPRIAGGSIDNQMILSSQVHYTRIIEFQGNRLPRRLNTGNQYWGDSVLTLLVSSLRNFNLGYDSTASAIQDFRVAVIKLKNLADMVSADDGKKLIQRLNIMQTSKSVLSAIAIDADSESFEYNSTPLTGVKGVLDKLDSRLVAATGLPHTIVLGEGATGSLSGGGQSEDKNLAKVVGSLQEKDLKKPVNRLMELIQSERLGVTQGNIEENMSWKFKPLWQHSDTEKAEIHSKQSTADTNYINTGVLSADEVALSRFAKDEFSLETQIDLNARINEFNPDPVDPDNPDDPEGNFDSKNCDVIQMRAGKFFVLSEAGRKIAGPFSTEEKAKKRLSEIEFFKKGKKDKSWLPKFLRKGSKKK